MPLYLLTWIYEYWSWEADIIGMQNIVLTQNESFIWFLIMNVWADYEETFKSWGIYHRFIYRDRNLISLALSHYRLLMAWYVKLVKCTAIELYYRGSKIVVAYNHGVSSQQG